MGACNFETIERISVPSPSDAVKAGRARERELKKGDSAMRLAWWDHPDLSIAKAVRTPTDYGKRAFYDVSDLAAVVFRAAVERAKYEHGHGGYTGTIAEKDTFVLFEPPKGQGANAARLVQGYDGKALDTLLNALEKDPAFSRVYNDKWGPAVCVYLGQSKGRSYPKTHAFLFCGWASS